MSTPGSILDKMPVQAKESNSIRSDGRLPGILSSPLNNRDRHLDTRDDCIDNRDSNLPYTGGADRHLASVSPTITRHPYTLPPIESFASRRDSPLSISSQRPLKRSRSRTSHMDVPGEWSMTRPGGNFSDFREASSATILDGPAYTASGYSMPSMSGDRDSYGQTWAIPASTSYPAYNQPAPYREYRSPPMTSVSHSSIFPPQPGFPHSGHVVNPPAVLHSEAGFIPSQDAGFRSSGFEIKRNRGNSDPTSDNSGNVEAPWATTTNIPINARPYTHGPDTRRFDLSGQPGPLSSPIPSSGFETIDGSRPGSKQGDLIPRRNPRSSVPALGIPPTGGTWHSSSTPNLPSHGGMLSGTPIERFPQEPLEPASGSSREKQVEARPGSSENPNRPRKRTKMKIESGEAGKKSTNRIVTSSRAHDQISTYCDELCELAQGSAQGESSTNASRLSALSRKILLQLSAIAAEAGLKDLIVTEEDLADDLKPLAIEDTPTDARNNRTDVPKGKTEGESSPNAPILGKSIAKPNSVMNFQTPQEAARDMEFIRMRRDELNAKAAAAEREKEGKDGDGGESAVQVEVGEMTVHSGLVSDTMGQDQVVPKLPDYDQVVIAGESLASPPAMLSASQHTITMDTAFMPPAPRHPFRFSTYQPFMPFPYVTNQDQGSIGSYSHPLDSNSMAFSTIGLPSPPSRSCHSCGIMHSTEWKTGPDGPETLCAVCGYHWLQQDQSWALLPGYKVSFQVGEAL